MNQEYKQHLMKHFKALSLALLPFLLVGFIIRLVQQQSITSNDIYVSFFIYFFLLGLLFIGSSVFGYIMRLDEPVGVIEN